MGKFLNEAVCRQRAAEKIEEISMGLAGLSRVDRFEKLREEFDGRAQGIKSCLDNFIPEEFESRGHAESSEKFLSRIMEAAIQGYHTLCEISNMMEKSGMSKINGTAVEFQNCQGQLIELQGIMEQSREFYKGEVQRRLDLIN